MTAMTTKEYNTILTKNKQKTKLVNTKKQDKINIEKETQKKSKKIKKQKIVGTQTLLNPNTGELIETTIIEKNIEQDFNFFKVWLLDLLNILELIGTKKMKVVNYILDNLDVKNNLFIGTHEEISKKLSVSRVVVSQTFKTLQESNFLIKKQNGVYMINPEILVKGKTGKRLNLLIKYNEIKKEKNN